ncbi:MAG: PilZ domain-containing protein [Nitrospira sp.]
MALPAVKKMASLLKAGSTASEKTVRPASADERRIQPRFTTQFRSTFSGSRDEWSGKTLDLSLGGCKIESEILVQPGGRFECRLHIPDLDWPIMIDEASVRWVDGNTFGLAFTRVRPEEQAKIRALITKLEKERPL